MVDADSVLLQALVKRAGERGLLAKPDFPQTNSGEAISDGGKGKAGAFHCENCGERNRFFQPRKCSNCCFKEERMVLNGD